MVSAPKAPDPYATAQAQTASNKETARTQQEMNMIDQTTPYGSLTYTQTGTYDDGTPKYSSTTSLSPELQGLIGSNIGNANSNSALERALLGNLQGQLSKPLDLGWSSTEAKLNELGRNTLDPEWNQRGDQLEQKLVNQGLRPGTEAYDAAMRNFSNQRSGAYNNLYLQGHQQAVNDLLAQYNNPLNTLNALRTGSQIAQPGVQTGQTPQTGVQGTNVAGIINSAYQQQAQQSNAAMGGLFGLGGSLITGLLSDRRAKTDIRRVGTAENGLPIYSYRYRTGGPVQIGFMADEVEALHPDAVVEIDGLKHVDYALAVE